MSLTLTKEDFYASHALSRQVETPKLAPAIADSLLLDVRPHLPVELLEQVLTLPAFTVAEWPVVLADQSPGSYAVRRERVYMALVPTPETDVPTEAESSADWQYEPLRTLWHVYLKPYWKQAAWSRFLLGHGYDMQKGGITVPTDREGTFQPAGAAHRAALQQAAANQADTLLSRLLRHVRHRHAGSYASDYPYGHPLHEPACTIHRNRRRPIRGV